MARKVLVADDSVTIQKVVGLTFANEDIELSFVDNGDEAISIVRKLRPDLILADVLMPGKSGYEVCEFVKSDPELRHTPVLLLTGTFEPFDADRCAQVRADGTITKPFESQTLIRQVHELLDRPRTRGADADGSAPATGAPQSERRAPAPAPAATARPADAAAPVAGGALTFEAGFDGERADEDFDLGGDTLDSVETAAPEEPAADEAFEFTRDPETALGRQGMEAPQTPAEGASETWTALSADQPDAPPASALPQDEDVWDLSDFEAVEEGPAAGAAEPGAGDEPEELWNEAAAEAIDIVESTNLEIDSEAPLTEAGLSSDAPSEPLDEIYDEPGTAPGESAGDEVDRFAEIAGESEFDEFDLSPSPDGSRSELETLDIEPPRAAPTAAEDAGTGESGGEDDDFLEREFSTGGAMLEELTLEEIPEDDAMAQAAEPEAPPQAAAAPEADGPVAPLSGIPSDKSAAIVRDAVKDAVEKVTWEAFSDLSETVVRAVQEKVEKIAWEVIPQMAETIIKEEIRKLKEGKE